MADKDRGDSTAVSAEIGKYLELLAKDPNSRVFAPLAEAYRKAGLLDDAVQTALEGLKVHPTYLGGRVALGRAYFEKKQFVEAAAEIQKVVKAAPDNLMAHKLLGQIAYEQNDLPTAEKSFRMVLMFDPRDQEAQQLLTAMGSGRPAAEAPPPPPPPLPPPPAPSLAAPPPVAPAPPAPSAPPAAPAAKSPEPFSLDDIPALESFELEEMPLGEIAFEPPPAPSEPPPVPRAAEPPSVPAIEMEMDVPAPAPAPLPPPEPIVETFVRQPWGGAPAGFREPPLEPAAAAAPALPPAEESPFEVFGRSMRTPPPESGKGEREAFAEIELEPTAYAPVEEAGPADDSPFEIFTREPRVPEGAASRAGRDASGYSDIELETTAYTVPEEGEAEAPPPPALDLTGLDEGFPRAAPAPEADPAEHWGGEPAGEEPPAAAAPPVEPAPAVDDDWEVLGGAAEALEPDPFGSDEEEPAPPASPGRGVFDTETLATLYANQGFHGRAAEIYRRLVAERPGDAALRDRLAEAEALEQGAAPPTAAPAAPIAPVPREPAAPAAAVPETGEGETIRRLRILQERFTQGRPQ